MLIEQAKRKRRRERRSFLSLPTHKCSKSNFLCPQNQNTTTTSSSWCLEKSWARYAFPLLLLKLFTLFGSFLPQTPKGNSSWRLWDIRFTDISTVDWFYSWFCFIRQCWPMLVDVALVDVGWCSLISNNVSWCRSMPVEVCQCLSILVDVCQCLLMSVDICQCLSMSVNVCQSLSVSINVFWCLSISISVCRCLMMSVKLKQLLVINFNLWVMVENIL